MFQFSQKYAKGSKACSRGIWEVLGKFWAVEIKHNDKDSEQANTLVEEAMNTLKLRYEIFTTLHLMLMYHMYYISNWAK